MDDVECHKPDPCSHQEPVEEFQGRRDAVRGLEAKDKSCSPVLDEVKRAKSRDKPIENETVAVIQSRENQGSGESELLGEADKKRIKAVACFLISRDANGRAVLRLDAMMFFRGMFLAWACGLMPFLLSRAVHVQYSEGTAERCRTVDFVPGHNLGGEGFDITTMQRKAAYVIDMESFLTSNGTCTLCKNSQFGNQEQKLPLNMVDWRVEVSCSLEVASTVHESSLSFANSTSSNIENDWRLGLEVMPTPGLSVGLVTAGSHSKLSEFAMERSTRDKYSYSSQEVFCKLYRYRVHDFPTLTTVFANQLKLLPNAYNSTTQNQYRKLIDRYGTHYITTVFLGGRVREVTALRTCELTLDELTTHEVRDCLGVEASINIKALSAETEHCKQLREKKLSNRKFSQKYSDRKSEILGGSLDAYTDLLFPTESQVSPYKPWVESLKALPDLITYSLAPLHELVPYGDHRKELLRRSITDYVIERSIQKKCPACPGGAVPNEEVKCNCVCKSSSILSADCCAKTWGQATMSVMVDRGTGLKGDPAGNPPDPYVKVFYSGIMHRTNWVKDSSNPKWDATFSFGTVTLRETEKLIFEVWDKDITYDDRLGRCEVTADAAPGERAGTCYLSNGSMSFRYRIECGPHLTGPYCSDYQPSVQ
ncbi:perforin-1-like [Ambystoma mexicanum]|uniref:perforin-1-like n=1 Tax=Ambystoma mexicanum TaxID=8296 RepID=UPI0037E92702